MWYLLEIFLNCLTCGGRSQYRIIISEQQPAPSLFLSIQSFFASSWDTLSSRHRRVSTDDLDLLESNQFDDDEEFESLLAIQESQLNYAPRYVPDTTEDVLLEEKVDTAKLMSTEEIEKLTLMIKNEYGKSYVGDVEQ